MRHLIVSLCLCFCLCADARAGEALRATAGKDAVHIVLSSGQQVRLADVAAPVEAHLAQQAVQRLGEILDGREVGLENQGQDRYGDQVAQVFLKRDTKPEWVQRLLVSEGMVSVYGTRIERSYALTLLSTEAEAREQKKGIWAHEAYADKAADTLQDGATGFVFCVGVVRDTESTSSEKHGISLDFSQDWDKGLTAYLSESVVRTLRSEGIKPAELIGKKVRVRGVVETERRPVMHIRQRAALEILS